jgi:hypothetical protein
VSTSKAAKEYQLKTATKAASRTSMFYPAVPCSGKWICAEVIVDENRQPTGRPWLSFAVHAAC